MEHNLIFSILRILKQNNILHHTNEGITICSVRDQHQGVELAAEMLYSTVDTKTVLYLSGGKTPKALYEKFAHEEQLYPGSVGQVDERFGEPFHANSNQKMIRESGLLRYFEMRDIPFYPMLNKIPPAPFRIKGETRDLSPLHMEGGGPQAGGFTLRQETAQAYDEKVRSLHATFQKSVGVLGIGSDGHTAGIAPNRRDQRDKGLEFKNPLFATERKHLLVSEFNDEHGYFGERVTMTFLGLSMVDLFLVLVFGDDKKQALEWMFKEGSESIRQAQDEEEIPARFYKRPEIAPKTIIITDQQI